MKFYMREPNAALVGMAKLTLEQRGAYNGVLDLLYANDGLLPDNDLAIAKSLFLHWRTWRAMKKQLIAAGKIWIEPTGMLNAKRVSATLIKASRVSQSQRMKVSERWKNYRIAQEFAKRGIKPGIGSGIDSGETVSEPLTLGVKNSKSPTKSTVGLYHIQVERKKETSQDGKDTPARASDEAQGVAEQPDNDEVFGAPPPAEPATKSTKDIASGLLAEAIRRKGWT